MEYINYPPKEEPEEKPKKPKQVYNLGAGLQFDQWDKELQKWVYRGNNIRLWHQGEIRFHKESTI